MRHLHVRSLLTLSLVFLGIILGLGAIAPALAQVSCGDTITTDTTIAAGDPITLAPCPCAPSPPAELFALKVVGNGVTPVVLDLNFQIIRGAPACEVGILIEGDLVTVKSGKITGFDTGLFADETSNSTVSGLQAFGNGDGIDLRGNGNKIQNNVVGPNSGDGIIVRNGMASDDKNTVMGNRADGNAGQGLIIRGSMNTVSGNVSQQNGGDGFEIAGNRSTIKQNRADGNGGEGFKIEGAWHTFTLNKSLRNGEDGYTVWATDSLFDRNGGDYNKWFGIFDGTTGGGTSGTANTYTGNRCTGNGAGKSDPAGLCK